MNERFRSCWRRAVRFHRDEAGNATLEKVLILTVAVIVLTFALKVGWPLIRNFMTRKLHEMQTESHTGAGE